MISRRPAKRAAVVTAVTLVPLAVFGGVGLAKGSPSASEYEYGPAGGQYGKVGVCHHTHSKKHPWVQINVSLQGWLHGHHPHHSGDFLVTPSTPCPPPVAPGAAPTVTTTHGNSGNHGNGNNGNNGKGHGKH